MFYRIDPEKDASFAVGATMETFLKIFSLDQHHAPTHRLDIVAALITHDYQHLLRGRDVVAWVKCREISMKIPENLYIAVLE